MSKSRKKGEERNWAEELDLDSPEEKKADPPYVLFVSKQDAATLLGGANNLRELLSKYVAGKIPHLAHFAVGTKLKTALWDKEKNIWAYQISSEAIAREDQQREILMTMSIANIAGKIVLLAPPLLL